MSDQLSDAIRFLQEDQKYFEKREEEYLELRKLLNNDCANALEGVRQRYRLTGIDIREKLGVLLKTAMSR